jgi:hypothetical protein
MKKARIIAKLVSLKAQLLLKKSQLRFLYKEYRQEHDHLDCGFALANCISPSLGLKWQKMEALISQCKNLDREIAKCLRA